jgi:hypothetical protein
VEQIRELAFWLVQDRVYNMAQCDPRIVQVAFQPAFAAQVHTWPEEDLARVTVFGVVGQDETCAMAVNEQPIFYSVRVWLLDDFRRASLLASAAVRVIMEWDPVGTPPPAGPTPAPADPVDRH